MMNVTKKGALLLSSLGLIAGVAGTIALQTHAATTPGLTDSDPANAAGKRQFAPPAASGSVTSVNGNIVTVTDKKSGTVFMVDATNAIIEKKSVMTGNGQEATARPTLATITVAGILAGDNVRVQGTVSGTKISATKIIDGMMGGFGGRGHMGKPGTSGTVASVSGNTITLTGTDGKTYTVDASGATLKKISAMVVSDVRTGDTLMVNGPVSGTTISAKNIMDGVFAKKINDSAPINGNQ